MNYFGMGMANSIILSIIEAAHREAFNIACLEICIGLGHGDMGDFRVG